MDLGNLPRGRAVELHLSGSAANVWLMDPSTYSRYKRGQQVRAQDELPYEAFEERELDLLISHATEDKAALVRPLAHALQHRGVEVWYDEFELRVGDSLRRKIDAGIARDELIRQSPSLVDRVALSTSALTVEEMADQIAEVVHPGDSKSRAA